MNKQEIEKIDGLLEIIGSIPALICGANQVINAVGGMENFKLLRKYKLIDELHYHPNVEHQVKISELGYKILAMPGGFKEYIEEIENKEKMEKEVYAFAKKSMNYSSKAVLQNKWIIFLMILSLVIAIIALYKQFNS